MAHAGFEPPPVPVYGRSTRRRREGKEEGRSYEEQQPLEQTENGLELCRFFQAGCCWYDGACTYRHAPAEEASGYKMVLCEEFVQSSRCSAIDCSGAHGKEELRTPWVFQGMQGFKTSLCTNHLLPDLNCWEASHNCWDAHGLLDLRRVPVASPPDLQAVDFTFCDAHIHLDQVLLARRYGSNWMYKRALCTHRPCRNPGCGWAHSLADQRPRLPFCSSDLEELAKELNSLPGGTFGGCVHSSCEVQTIGETVELVEWGRESLGGHVYAAFGIHPTNFEAYTPEVEAEIEAALKRCGAQGVAWGECGLDYYHSASTEDFSAVRRQMCDVFERQARAAVRLGLPLVVHSRDAEEDTIDILRRSVPAEHLVYLHAYTGPYDAEMLTTFLAEWPNSVVGIAGAVSYPTAWNLHNLAWALPLERILLETDGPYMSPEPYRYDNSHPGHIPWVADSVARAKRIPLVEVLAATTSNFRRFFRLDQ